MLSEVADADGIESTTFFYQWLSDEADIEGGTDATYTLTAAEEGKKIKVRVTFTDDGGTGETLVSTATGAVTARGKLSVADAEASEEEDAALAFVVTLDPAAMSSVTVDYATANGTATAGEDYSAASGTLTFEPGDTTKTVSVQISDDAEDDDGETLTLSLSNASGADLGDAEATGTIRNSETPQPDPLTASFTSVPEAHDGESAFNFQVEFSEDVDTLSDDSFTVNEGEVTGTQEVGGRSDLWKVTVEPDSDDAVTVTLPGNRACNTSGAVCTADDRQLSNSPSTTVEGPPNETKSDPLTASFSGMPDSHDGSSEFTFSLTFSEEPDEDLSYRTLRDHAFDITGGDVAKARRQEQGSNRSWTIHVEPDGDDAVTIRLPATTDCSATGAICTDDGRKLSNSPSDTVDGPPSEPLTASFSGMPAEHDGSSEFTFSLTFSEELDDNFSYRTLRDHAFDVDGGDVRRSRREEQGSNLAWTIHVEPESQEAVSIRLPATQSCSASGAICTGDGRPLSNSPAATVAGPAGLSVADATIDFTVTLDRAALGTVTVDYETADGTATAGSDYTAASGTLSFAAGERTKTVSVTLLDDTHDEGEETFTLTLSNASGAVIADGEASGTIENHDPLPRALLARFGRTAAVHVVEHVEERLQASREPGFRGRFAGQELRRGMERDIALNFLGRLGGAERPGSGAARAWGWPRPAR